MPSLSDHQSSEFVKLLYMGGSGTGKTGSLVSLMQAGYKLRIIDLDNGLDALKNHAMQVGADLDTVQFVTNRDSYKSSNLGPKCDKPRALVQTARLIDKWEDESIPAEWGPDHILVIDSLTMLGKGAYAWARSQNPSGQDKRQWFQAAQEVVDNIVDTVTGEEFRTNVICITHVDLIEDENGIIKGVPTTIGRSLSKKLPRYFNTMLLAESRAIGKEVRRKIKTAPTNQIDLKNPAPFRIDNEYPLETGMADIFKNLKETQHG